MLAFLTWLSHLPHGAYIHFLDVVWNAVHPGAHGAPRLVTCNPLRGCRTYIQWGSNRIFVK